MNRPGPGSVTWRIQGERLVVLGWTRAILLQLAHPLVAAGIDAHSTFREGPLAPYRRLWSTIAAMRALTFGTEADAARTAAAINAIHARVRGAITGSEGPWSTGAPYSAQDPALLAWVHMTLVDSLLVAYEQLVSPLAQTDRDRWCAEARLSGVWVGVRPDELPGDTTALAQAIERRRAASELVVSEPARRVAQALLHPPLAWAGGPVAVAARRFAVGSLPGWLRDQYEAAWRPADEDRLKRSVARIRRWRARMPDAVMRWPEAR